MASGRIFLLELKTKYTGIYTFLKEGQIKISTTVNIFNVSIDKGVLSIDCGAKHELGEWGYNDVHTVTSKRVSNSKKCTLLKISVHCLLS